MLFCWEYQVKLQSVQQTVQDGEQSLDLTTAASAGRSSNQPACDRIMANCRYCWFPRTSTKEGKNGELVLGWESFSFTVNSKVCSKKYDKSGVVGPKLPITSVDQILNTEVE